jgi:hypothetical protein
MNGPPNVAAVHHELKVSPSNLKLCVASLQLPAKTQFPGTHEPDLSLPGSWVGAAFIALSATRRHCDHPFTLQPGAPGLAIRSPVRRNARRQFDERDGSQPKER